jgi:WD40 repeat protein
MKKRERQKLETKIDGLQELIYEQEQAQANDDSALACGELATPQYAKAKGDHERRINRYQRELRGAQDRLDQLQGRTMDTRGPLIRLWSLIALITLLPLGACALGSWLLIPRVTHQYTLTGQTNSITVGHTDIVTDVAWSPDGTRLALASYDTTVRVWDAATGTILHTLTGHTKVVYSVAWSPDGTRLASFSYDDTARVWDAATGAMLHTLTGIKGGVWSPDGTRLVLNWDNKTVRIWDATTGATLCMVT